ncbi:MAG: hypothetical protein U0R49_11650 [Fimbriimonadales bacterium]
MRRLLFGIVSAGRCLFDIHSSLSHRAFGRDNKKAPYYGLGLLAVSFAILLLRDGQWAAQDTFSLLVFLSLPALFVLLFGPVLFIGLVVLSLFGRLPSQEDHHSS